MHVTFLNSRIVLRYKLKVAKWESLLDFPLKILINKFLIFQILINENEKENYRVFRRKNSNLFEILHLRAL